eukprot:TRINITY_DN2260_c0_g1_i1.p1 TRINITY_DN2260_c0_g1~~TRINITY_DN2260_c0_g1_i1.p1  ORF type:complete len:622 (-),score=114.11 TRINITY_DN2260_c0_g1_i1:1144-2955(-)
MPGLIGRSFHCDYTSPGLLSPQRRKTYIRKQKEFLYHIRAQNQQPSTAPEEKGSETPPESGNDKNLKRTIADLDALLGIEEEENDSNNVSAQGKTDISISSAALKEIAKVEAEKAVQRKIGKPGDQDQVTDQITEQLQKIMNQARKADEGSSQQTLQREIQNLVKMVTDETILSKEDIKKIKDILGPQSFWVTETREVEGMIGGVLIRGNLRTDKTEVLKILEEGIQKLHGPNKYEVIMVKDIQNNAQQMQPSETTKERVAFQIIPANIARPQATPPWYGFWALLCGLGTFITLLQIGTVSNLPTLSKEALDFLADPNSFNSGMLPPGMSENDLLVFVQKSVTIAGLILGTQVGHEFGHRVVAQIKGVKLGLPILVPNMQIGTFGAVTPIRSLVKDKQTMFDVAFAGPAVGLVLSGGLFFAGLYLTSLQLGQDLSADQLASYIPVPTTLFQGSLLLNSISKGVLGMQPFQGQSVTIHPLMISGWCGLTATALNLLPAGRLDGGRMLNAAFGRNAGLLGGFFTIIGLALGLLGSNLSLYFGIYLLFFQRETEKIVKDEVTEASAASKRLTLLFITLAIFILLPAPPDNVADAFNSIANDPTYFL